MVLLLAIEHLNYLETSIINKTSTIKNPVSLSKPIIEVIEDFI